MNYGESEFKTRREYLESLADGLNLPRQVVLMMAQIRGPGEDFDGLVTACEEEAARRKKYRPQWPIGGRPTKNV